MTAEPDLLPDDVATLTADAIAYFNGLGTKPASRMAQAIAQERANLAELQREIEALRAKVDRMKDMAMMQAARAAAAEREVSHRKARAERLEEALRELRNHTSVNSDQIALIDTALAQENDDA